MKEKKLPIFIKTLNILIFLAVFAFINASNSYAQNIADDKKGVFNPTGRPLPRFVSLAKDIINVRAGPGQKYPVKWVIKKRGLPVEIILEFDHWRKIKDKDGAEGWVFKTLLSGKRTAIILGNDDVNLYNKSGIFFNKKLEVSAVIEPSTLVEIKSCDQKFCNVSASGISGLIERKSLWGVYESEKFD